MQKVGRHILGEPVAAAETIAARTAQAGTLRERLTALLSNTSIKTRLEKGDSDVARQVSERIEEYERVIAGNLEIASLKEHPGWQRLRHDVEARIERDLAGMPDQAIAREMRGDMTALVNAIEQKLWRGFFASFDNAEKEVVQGRGRIKALLDAIHIPTRKQR